MAYGEAGNRASVQIASRISGPDKGPQVADLCTATIRAVALGVVGIAFIQMLLVGLGFVFKGVPGAGLLALAVLLLGIMQLPATLITVPVIAFVIAYRRGQHRDHHLLHLRLRRGPGGQRAQAIDAGARGRCADAGDIDRSLGRDGHRRHSWLVHRPGGAGGGLPVVLAVGAGSAAGRQGCNQDRTGTGAPSAGSWFRTRGNRSRQGPARRRHQRRPAP